MNLQHQVSTMEQSEALKSLCISQQAVFSWCGDKNHIPIEHNPEGNPWVWVDHTVPINAEEEDHRQDVSSAKPFAAAYTVAELLQMLPDKVVTRRENGKYEISVSKEDYPGFHDQGKFFFVSSDTSFAEALAAFLITGIKKGISGFEIPSINERLL